MAKDKVDIEIIRRYIRGELTPREMHSLERRAQDDPAWMDVILGMESDTEAVHDANIAALRERVASRIGRGRVRRLAPIQRWAIAATVLVAFTLGTLWFSQWHTLDENQPTIASAPADTGTQQAEQRAVSSPHETLRKNAAEETTATAPPSKPPTSATEADAASKSAAAPATVTKEQASDTSEPPVVIGYGRQERSGVVGAVTLPPDTEQTKQEEYALNARTAKIRLRGTSGTAMQPEQGLVTGRVVDRETQTPLTGVVLRLSDDRAVTTDSAGRFTLAQPPDTLQAQLIGYEEQTVTLTGQDSLTIALQPDVAALSEVVVVGYGDKRKPERTFHPEPAAGWKAYNRYLKKGVRQAESLKGTVVLTFTIDEQGTPTDIRVIRSTHPALGERATQLVREGPKWQPGKNGERKVELQVKF
ncbi:TonB family protein [Parapedobacter defluvii]|uniref:TonB family protein n=1 Tax=Parapedobacter defluvii TaxID=2045106 RepID=UPI003341F180